MKFTTRLKWITFFIATLVTLYFALGIYQFHHDDAVIGETTSVTEYPTEEDADTAILNYKKLNDALNKTENDYDKARYALEDYTKRFGSESSSFMGPLGIATYTDRDPGNPFSPAKPESTQERYYLILNNYTIRTQKYLMGDRIYYGFHGSFYKKELVVDSAAQKKRWQTKQINYMPIITENESLQTTANPSGHILIPISKTTYSLLNVFWWIMLFAILITYIHLIIGNFIRVAVSISKGKAFTEANYHWLLQAGLSLLSLTLLGFFIHILFYFIFLPRLDAEWRPDINWLSLIGYLSIAIFIILLAFAFKKGTRMQQEQDLTI